MSVNATSFNAGSAPRALSSMETQWLNSVPPEMRGQVAQQLAMFRENELVNYMMPMLGQMQGMGQGLGIPGGGSGLNRGDIMEQQQLAQEQKMLQSLERKVAAESNKSSKMHDIAMAIINNLK